VIEDTATPCALATLEKLPAVATATKVETVSSITVPSFADIAK
jgi:hypothetical protein